MRYPKANFADTSYCVTPTCRTKLQLAFSNGTDVLAGSLEPLSLASLFGGLTAQLFETLPVNETLVIVDAEQDQRGHPLPGACARCAVRRIGTNVAS